MNKEERRLRRQEEKRLIREATDKIGKPYLIYRVLSAIIDFLLMVILSVAFEWCFSVTVFDAFGFKEANQNILVLAEKSGLFVKNGNDYTNVKFFEEGVDNTKLANANIYYFYTTDERAINDHKLEEYNAAKIESGLFDSNYQVISEDFDLVNAFYSIQYSNAVDYFENSDEYLLNYSKIISTMGTTLLISIVISSSIYFLLIPLLLPHGATIIQRLFKIGVMDLEHNKIVSKKQIVLRYIIHVSVNYLAPIVLMLKFNAQQYAFLPVVVNLFMICLTKNNRGIADFLTNTLIVNKEKYEVLEYEVNKENENIISK